MKNQDVKYHDDFIVTISAINTLAMPASVGIVDETQTAMFPRETGNPRVKTAVLRRLEIPRRVTRLHASTPGGPHVYHVIASDPITEWLLEALRSDYNTLWAPGEKEGALLKLGNEMQGTIDVLTGIVGDQKTALETLRTHANEQYRLIKNQSEVIDQLSHMSFWTWLGFAVRGLWRRKAKK